MRGGRHWFTLTIICLQLLCSASLLTIVALYQFGVQENNT
jgi:hypothetical protein